MAISGSQPAYLQARAGIARAGASRFGAYTAPPLVVTINGVDRTALIDLYTIRVLDDFYALPDSASFECWFVPNIGDEIVITALTGKDFGGVVTRVKQTRDRLSTGRLVVNVSCLDWNYILGGVYVFSRIYTALSATAIAADLIGLAPAGFTSTAGIAPGLPTVSMTFNRVTLPDALSQLCDAIGGGYYLDTAKVLQLFLTDTTTSVPAVLNSANTDWRALTYEQSIEALANRAYVEGAPATILDVGDVAPGSTVIPLDDVSLLAQPSGSVITADGQVLTYTGVTTAASSSQPSPGAAVGLSLPVRVSSITRTGANLAIVTTAAPHGFVNGASITIAGAGLLTGALLTTRVGAYNGTYPIIVIDATHFSFILYGMPLSPAVVGASKSVLGMSRLIGVQPSSQVTVSVAGLHGYITGDVINIAGAVQPEYNGDHVITVISTNSFTFIIGQTPATTATGSITCVGVMTAAVQPGALKSGGVYGYKVTFGDNADGQTVPSVAFTGTVPAAVLPAGFPVLLQHVNQLGEGGEWGGLTNGPYLYGVTFLTPVGPVTPTGVQLSGETVPGALVAIVADDSQNKPEFPTLGSSIVVGGGGLGTGWYGYALALTTAAGETVPSTRQTQFTAGGTNAIPIFSPSTRGAAPRSPAATGWRLYRTSLQTSSFNASTAALHLVGALPLAFVEYDDGLGDGGLGGSPLSSGTARLGSRIDFSALPISPVDYVIGRNVYRSAVNGSALQQVLSLLDNSTLTGSEALADSAREAAAPTIDTATQGQMSVSVPVSANPFVAVRKVYRTALNGSDYKLLVTIPDNVAISFLDNVADASLGQSAPTLPTAASGVSITGIPVSGPGSIGVTLPNGSTVSVWVQVDDLASQALYGRTRAGYVSDATLNAAAAATRAAALLLLGKNAQIAGSYITENVASRTGRPVTIDMAAAWGIAGSFVIQQVDKSYDIDHVPMQRTVTYANQTPDKDLYRILRALQRQAVGP